MKRRTIFLLASLMLVGVLPASAQNKVALKVLYVGGSTDYDSGKRMDPAEKSRLVQQRTVSWKQMLEQYFSTVATVDAQEWTEQLSAQYDVTVMDGVPRPIAPGVQDAAKQAYMRPLYVSEDFSLPMVTIGEVSSRIGSRIGIKNDWYCLCLENYAFGWKKDHAIFKGPFKVKLKTEKRPTPSLAFHFQYETDEKIPQTMSMWQVQTRGYKDTPGYAAGLIARYSGYEDSPEAEYISSGVSSKSIRAVAIGRHGNYFHWGFSASPADMTEQAKAVFANAVVYASKFKGQGVISRKYNEAIATRDWARAIIHMSSPEGYQEIIKMNDEAMDELKQRAEKAKEKNAKGETLTEEEKYLLTFRPSPAPSREQIMKQYVGDYYEQFGMDSEAYRKFFTENRDYLYGGEGRIQMVLDEDVKSLGIPNNDIRLIDAAITLLEKGTDVEKAHRILTRYTQKDFTTAKEWRQWFDANRNNMFFTESGGWVWLVNSREKGANDYTGWLRRKSNLSIESGEVTAQNPVAVTAARGFLDNGEQVIYVKFKIYCGFHIYGFVSSDDPFIPTKVSLHLPEGVTTIGEMELPPARVLSTNGTTIYEDEAVFQQRIKGQVKGDITCTVEYQCCDDHVCLPPVNTTITVK